MPREEIDQFFEVAASSAFYDHLTGLRPSCERELSAILAFRHLSGKVRWDLIPARNVLTHERIFSSKIVFADDIVLAEYPLFAQKQDEINRWGQMAPDLIFLGGDNSRLVFVEAKVDSHFTHSDSPPDGQVSRYLEYMDSVKADEKVLVIICPRCNDEWYGDRLKWAADAAQNGINVYVIVWEDVFSCVQN